MPEPGENTRLLSQEVEAAQSYDAAQAQEQSRFERARRQRILVLLSLSIVAVDFGNGLSYAPQLSILEQIICQHLHMHPAALLASTDPPICKAPDVQGELAIVNGWKDTFDQVPGILLALPYGLAADRIGRKPIILLALAGLLLEETAMRLIFWASSMDLIPVRAVWATPVMQLIGGGPQIATSMVYAMLTDVFPIQHRAPLFFQLAAVILLGEILATPISAALMSLTNPWVPSLAGMAVEIVGFLAAAATPETCPSNKPSETVVARGGPDDANEDTPKHQTWRSSVAKRLRTIPKLGLTSAVTANMVCIVGAFIMASIGRQALQLIIQYASKRFSWSIARASTLITVKGIVNLVVLLVILPKLSTILSRHMPSTNKDLRLVQGSMAILAVGTTLMAFAGSPWLFTAGVCLFAMGWGSYSALRSLATALVLPTHIGLLNTSIALAQSIGAMVAGPILASAFKTGVSHGGVLVGLPYMVAAVLFFGATALTWAIRIQQPTYSTESESESESQSEHDI